MADLFISYARKDRPRCSEIGEALAALKIGVWFDVGIEPGHSFDREIERELNAAKAVLVLWSEASVGSDWVRNEARSGKESDRLAALQIEPCQLPLEFRSVQAEPVPTDQPVAASPAWPAVLRRLGDLLGRPGLSDYARLAAEADARPDAWRRWIAANPADPLVADAVERMIEGAAPDLKGQLASERARRSALEAELAEHVETGRAQAGEVANAGRELARRERERDEAVRARADAEAELAALRENLATGRGGGSLISANVGAGIVLDQRLAIYACVLLWVLALWFLSSSIGRLSDARGGLGDVVRLIFGVVALVVPAAIVTIVILVKRRALAAKDAAAPPPAPPG